MSGSTKEVTTTNTPPRNLNRREFLQISALATAGIALSACAPPETNSPNGQGLETTLKLMRGEMPSVKETVEMINQLGIQKESQLAGIMIDLVRLQPGINIDELLDAIPNSSEQINQRISDLLRRLTQEISLFDSHRPINHRMAFAQAKAREQGVQVNEYLAKELFNRVESLIAKSPSLEGLFPSFYPWKNVKQMGTIPQEIFQDVQLSLYYYETLQTDLTNGYLQKGYDYAFVNSSIAETAQALNWSSNQEKIDKALESMLVALFPMVPEELALQNNEARWGDQSNVINLFQEQLTDICLFLLRQSVNNEIIFQKIQLLYSAVQQEIDPSRIIPDEELKTLLTNPDEEEKLRSAIARSISGIAIAQNANLKDQYRPIKKPMMLISFRDSSLPILIPEETFPTESDLYKTAQLFIPSHRPDPQGVWGVYSEFAPLLKTDIQNFFSGSTTKGIEFFLLNNQVIAVTAQNIGMFNTLHPTAKALTILSISHRTRGELGSAFDDLDEFFKQGRADAFELIGEGLAELFGIENKKDDDQKNKSPENHRVVGTFAVCKVPPQEYISPATAVKHPAKSMFWVTITQGSDGLYYAHNFEKFPKSTGPHYASIKNGILTVQKDSASTASGQQYKVMQELSPGYYNASLNQLDQELYKQFLRQAQPEETTKKLALLLRQAMLTTSSGSVHKRQYVAVPKETATAYLVTKVPLSGKILNQTEIGSFSRDPQPILGANLSTAFNHDGEICVILATIRRNGLGPGSPEAMVLVPKNQVEVLEIPTIEADFKHYAYSQVAVFAAFTVVTKFLNTHIGGEFDLGYALYGVLHELVRMNSGIGTDINP